MLRKRNEKYMTVVTAEFHFQPCLFICYIIGLLFNYLTLPISPPYPPPDKFIKYLNIPCYSSYVVSQQGSHMYRGCVGGVDQYDVTQVVRSRGRETAGLAANTCGPYEFYNFRLDKRKNSLTLSWISTHELWLKC
jgi:hypothetical protein